METGGPHAPPPVSGVPAPKVLVSLLVSLKSLMCCHAKLIQRLGLGWVPRAWAGASRGLGPGPTGVCHSEKSPGRGLAKGWE